MIVIPPLLCTECFRPPHLFSACVEDGVPAWDAQRPEPGHYAWACHIDGYVFTYIYGWRASCLRVRELEGGAVLIKGLCDSLDQARQEATDRARETAGVYEGIGRALVVPALSFMQRRAGLDERYRAEATRLAVLQRERGLG